MKWHDFVNMEHQKIGKVMLHQVQDHFVQMFEKESNKKKYFNFEKIKKVTASFVISLESLGDGFFIFPGIEIGTEVPNKSATFFGGGGGEVTISSSSSSELISFS